MTSTPVSRPAAALHSGASRIRSRVPGVLARLHRWAESGWGSAATGTWGFLQGSLVPGPSEAMLIPLGLSDPPRAPRLALWAALGATVGGALAYVVGASALELLRVPLDAIGISASVLERERSRFDQWGWWLIFASTMSPLSTKIVCIAAGAFGYPFAPFLAAIGIGRTLRFLGVGVGLLLFGERISAWLAGNGKVRNSA